MSAFQAQKAPSSKRSLYANLSAAAAASQGRLESIDVSAWDNAKDNLMKAILCCSSRLTSIVGSIFW